MLEQTYKREKQLEAFDRLLNIMDRLRAECPWDRKQTLESLRALTIEEVYELADAITQNDLRELRKELGDVLLHIVFYAKIASESQSFDIADVINSLCEKLIYRHPHVFGSEKAADDQEVSKNWEQLKIKEKDGNRSVLGGLPQSLPTLIKAYRMQDKARGVGFDWDEPHQVWDKVNEEIDELKEAIAQNNNKDMEAEFGDLFFSLINAARLYNINPDDALERTNRKFITRFNYLEKQTIAQGRQLSELSLDEMEAIWQKAKTEAP